MSKTRRGFYEAYHQEAPSHPIEILKQRRRMEVLAGLLPDQVGSVLVIGCGRGEELEVFRGRVTAIDWSLTGLAVAREHRSEPMLSQADACHLPFRSGIFDTVICSEVIEHIPAAEKALSEMARVLRPAGRLVLSTPNYWSLFGLARILGEAVTGKPHTSGDQPYDRWTTPPALMGLLENHFEKTRSAGAWYFPPFGRGDRQISARLTVPLVRLCRPLDRFSSRAMPWLGHLIFVTATRRRPARHSDQGAVLDRRPDRRPGPAEPSR